MLFFCYNILITQVKQGRFNPMRNVIIAEPPGSIIPRARELSIFNDMAILPADHPVKQSSNNKHKVLNYLLEFSGWLPAIHYGLTRVTVRRWRSLGCTQLRLGCSARRTVSSWYLLFPGNFNRQIFWRFRM